MFLDESCGEMRVQIITPSQLLERHIVEIEEGCKWEDFMAILRTRLHFHRIRAVYREDSDSTKTRVMAMHDIVAGDRLLVKPEHDKAQLEAERRAIIMFERGKKRRLAGKVRWI